MHTGYNSRQTYVDGSEEGGLCRYCRAATTASGPYSHNSDADYAEIVESRSKMRVLPGSDLPLLWYDEPSVAVWQDDKEEEDNVQNR